MSQLFKDIADDSLFQPNNSDLNLKGKTLGELRTDHQDEDNDDEDLDELQDRVDEELEIPPMPSNPGGSIFSDLGSGGFDEGVADTAVKELLSETNLLMKTDLNAAAIPIVARIMVLAVKYKADQLWRFIWTYLRLRVSVNREGRREIVALSLRRSGFQEDDDL